MPTTTAQPPSGHIFERPARVAMSGNTKYRLPDGRQVKKRIGPAWSCRGRPATGTFTKRTAEDWLRDLLDEARRGTLPAMVQTRATFADAAAEYLRWIEQDRARKPSTVRDYRSIINAHLLPAFGEQRLEDITTEAVERWAEGLAAGGRMNTRHGAEDPHDPPWSDGAGQAGLEAAAQPGRRRREAGPAPFDADRGLLARGRHGARA
ncbi:MAG TPA: N-terminal phage integrase SAM-like domain-containing protein [Capillimicrobium sp.]|nr:N-terminal phage integrase SAM-like domain-containing protein [Capillimicrobium sp.]